MEYDLLVVGNGFDLACKYNTKYSDFLNEYSYVTTKNNLLLFFLSASYKKYYINEEWNGFENLLCQYLQFIDYLFSDNKNIYFSFSNLTYNSSGIEYYEYCQWEIKNKNILPYNIRAILNLENPLGNIMKFYSDINCKNHFNKIDECVSERFYIRYKINIAMVNANKTFIMKNILAYLDDLLKDVEEELKKYIKNETKKIKYLTNNLNDTTSKMILSFNYSKTAEIFYNLNEADIVYVHGNVDTDIVLGIEPLMINNQTFNEESDFIKFFKRFRRIYKDCNKYFNEKIINRLNEDSIIAFYGHSFDLSDKSILKILFENKYKKYFIYCYKNINIYKLNLSKLIGLDLLNDLYNDGKIEFILVNE